MTIRRINHTGRKRIGLRDIRITLRENGDGPITFEATFDLAEYDLPDDGRIYVEAYRQTSWMRFDFGTVRRICPPPDRALTEFDSGEALLFRAKVTANSGRRGVIIAEADQIRPLRPDAHNSDRIPLISVIPSDALDNVIWQVAFKDERRPILEINRSVNDWRGLARDARFASLVLPSVFREVLTQVLIVEDFDNLEDPADWRSRWLEFACGLPGVESVPRGEDQERRSEWLEEAVRAFARQHSLLPRFFKSWAGDD
jgi:hypothetical protein